MKIAFLSLTGNVRSFVEKVGGDSVEIPYSNPFLQMGEPFIVVVPSYDDDITALIADFLTYKDNLHHLRGFVGSGNRNFDTAYCFNAKELAKRFKQPLLLLFEISGTAEDVAKLQKEVGIIGVTEID